MTPSWLLALAALCFPAAALLEFSRPAAKTGTPGAQRTAMDDNVRALLEKVRLAMNESNPTLGLPALDPLRLSDVSLDINKGVTRLCGLLPSVEVRGISGFQLDALSVKLVLLRADFGLHVPEVRASGRYNVTGAISGLLPVYGSGPFSVQLTGLNVTNCYLKLGSNDGDLFLKNFTFDYSIGSVKLQLDDLLGGDSLGAAVNQMLNDVLPQLLADYKPDIVAFAASTVTTYADKFLSGKSVSDLLAIINGS
ncbi:uncharacterized protein LOC134532027 [Bacillus rossius redtenbacheri]|uniref:uncharacterized protein LOC134532027 n=1 Tax=Bacillus rossius redtenbacheri TaxID=93214 RepID=UPI002FDCAABE